jgi:hypothetical protein
MLTRDAILSRNVLEKSRVDVPEWGSLFVRVMTGDERDRFEILMTKFDKRHFRALVVAFTACDESGNRLFTEDDVAALGGLPSSELTLIVEASLRVNKLTGADVKELEKNSATSPSDGSRSDSPPTAA